MMFQTDSRTMQAIQVHVYNGGPVARVVSVSIDATEMEPKLFLGGYRNPANNSKYVHACT